APSFVRGVYSCPAGEVVIELRHPSIAPADAVRTEKFAIVTARGTPPTAFSAALEKRVREGEAAFEWVRPKIQEPDVPGDAVIHTHVNESVVWWIVVGKTFFIVLFVGILVALWRSRREMLTRDAVPVLLITALALFLRVIAYGGPADIRAVIGDARPSRGGFVVFSRLVFALLPATDESIWTVDRVCGALSVPLLYAVVRKRFADPLIALGAATALAITPLLVRFSASDTPYIPLCAAFLGAFVAYDRYVERPALSTLALAFGLLSAAMQLRPDGGWLLVPAALVALAGPLPARSAVFRPVPVAGAVAFVAINALPVAVAASGHAGGGYFGSFVLFGTLYGSPWAVPAMTPRSLALLLVVGAVAAAGHGRAGLAWLAATLVADPVDFSAAWGLGHYSNARYHIPAMYLACALVGIGAVATIRFFGRL